MQIRRLISIPFVAILVAQGCADHVSRNAEAPRLPDDEKKVTNGPVAPPPPAGSPAAAPPRGNLYAQSGAMAMGDSASAGVVGGVVGGSVGGNAYRPATIAPSSREEEFNTEEYGRIDENPFHRVVDQPLSTFSVDVDRAAYANVRRFLLDARQLPPRDAVRIEEMVNYFHYDYGEPKGQDPVAIETELGDCPWSPEHRLLKVGLQARRIETDRLPDSNLVFLIDVSGSMMSSDKLPLIKSALPLLVDQLREQDHVSIVVYAGAAGLVLPPTSGDDRGAILSALDELQAGGSTAGGAGIELAYRLAKENFVRGGNNRVILATDGDFNVGTSGDGELEKLIEEKRKDGIFLTVLGFGTGNIKDSKMELLADRGNGNYAYIDSLMEARKTLVSEMGGTLFTVAKDVKVQIEFNPDRVAGYRLLGYENRLLRSQDFNNDQKDAGDVGSGHSVTALYEIVPAGQEVPGASVDPLKYQKTASTGSTAELLTLKVRYKDPDGSESRLMTRTVPDTVRALRETSGDFRFAAAVAELGMLLRGSEQRGESSYGQVLRLAGQREGDDPYRAEFVELVQAAKALSQTAEAKVTR